MVGGGKVAARKVAMLKRAGGRVTVVSPAACEEIQAHVRQGEINYLERGYQEADMDGMALVIAATDDADLNRSVAQQANGAGIPVNVVDSLEDCSFIVPSIIDRSPVQVAV